MNSSKILTAVTCKKCGARIEANEASCSFCGWTVYEHAERAYFEELEDIREDMEDLEYIPQIETKRSAKRILIGCVVFIIVALILCALSYLKANGVIG